MFGSKNKAADDKKQKDTIEARNRADSTVYQVEKMLKEHRDKVSAEDATAVDTALEAARKAIGVIAIGASTGGPQAIEAVLTRLPGGLPPIVISQHMPAGYTAMFAKRLNDGSQLTVVEAAGGETLTRGCA